MNYLCCPVPINGHGSIRSVAYVFFIFPFYFVSFYFLICAVDVFVSIVFWGMFTVLCNVRRGENHFTITLETLIVTSLNVAIGKKMVRPIFRLSGAAMRTVNDDHV